MLGRAGRDGGLEEDVMLSAAVVVLAAGADERTDVDDAPAPALSHGFGGDGFAIVQGRLTYRQLMGCVATP